MERLVKGIEFETWINTKNKEGLTALHLAASYGCSEVLKVLLGDLNLPHVDIAAVDGVGNTALHLAAAKNKLCAVVELLKAMEDFGTKQKICGASKHRLACMRTVSC